MKMQTISVIVPVFNGERFLAEAIRSVLAQDLPPDELIVVDDGSTDGSARLAAELAATSSVPIRYVFQSNQGPSSARNHGLRLATGDLLAFIDTDDLWDRNKLSTQVAYLAAHHDILIVRSMIQMFEVRDGNILAIESPCQGVNLGCALFRRKAFEVVGTFDETMRLSEDLDWYLRASEHGLFQPVLPGTTFWYRKHDHNIWLGRPQLMNPTFGAIKKHLDRHRFLSAQKNSTENGRTENGQPYVITAPKHPAK